MFICVRYPFGCASSPEASVQLCVGCDSILELCTIHVGSPRYFCQVSGALFTACTAHSPGLLHGGSCVYLCWYIFGTSAACVVSCIAVGCVGV